MSGDYFQLGFPRRATYRKSENGVSKANRTVKRYNGKTPIYRSLYTFTGYPSSRTAIINKIFFDFDENNGRELTDLRILHEKLVEENLAHRMYFSGTGFHLFIETKEVYAELYPTISKAIRNVFGKYISELGIAPDPKTKDIMRIARIPNTINLKSHLFCIPLCAEEIYKDREYIASLALQPRHVENRVDGDKLDLTKYLGECDYEIDYIPYDSEIEGLDGLIEEETPRCVFAALNEGDCGYQERFVIITALRDLCFSIGDANEVLKANLTPKKYNHCIHAEQQLAYLYGRPHLLFPSCDTIQSYEMCVEGCPGQRIYFDDVLAQIVKEENFDAEMKQMEAEGRQVEAEAAKIIPRQYMDLDVDWEEELHFDDVLEGLDE